MTDRELMQQALDALVDLSYEKYWYSWHEKAVESLRDRLAEPEETVMFGLPICDRCGKTNPAEIHTCTPNHVDNQQWKYNPMTGEPLIDGWPLYSGLPKRKWVGLTDKEIEDIWGEPLDLMYSRNFEAIKNIEAKLKEKNL